MQPDFEPVPPDRRPSGNPPVRESGSVSFRIASTHQPAYADCTPARSSPDAGAFRLIILMITMKPVISITAGA